MTTGIGRGTRLVSEFVRCNAAYEDLRDGFFGSKRIRDTRLVVPASPATAFGSVRQTGRTGVSVLTRFWAVSI